MIFSDDEFIFDISDDETFCSDDFEIMFQENTLTITDKIIKIDLNKLVKTKGHNTFEFISQMIDKYGLVKIKEFIEELKQDIYSLLYLDVDIYKLYLNDYKIDITDLVMLFNETKDNMMLQTLVDEDNLIEALIIAYNDEYKFAYNILSEHINKIKNSDKLMNLPMEYKMLPIWEDCMHESPLEYELPLEVLHHL